MPSAGTSSFSFAKFTRKVLHKIQIAGCDGYYKKVFRNSEGVMSAYSYKKGSFAAKDGIEISYQKWTVDSPKGVVVLVHGLGEHAGRYMNIINTMRDKGVSFYGADHRGHGSSGGKRGHIMSWMEYVNDLKMFVNIVKSENKDVPVVMLGHSMGGAIALRFALTFLNDLSGLVLSSAGVKPIIHASSAKIAMGDFFSETLSIIQHEKWNRCA